MEYQIKKNAPLIERRKGWGKWQKLLAEMDVGDAVPLEDNENLYRLLEIFLELTKVPMVLNTSFNLAGKPIVRDLKQAIEVLDNSLIEFMWLPDIKKMVVRPNDPS